MSYQNSDSELYPGGVNIGFEIGGYITGLLHRSVSLVFGPTDFSYETQVDIETQSDYLSREDGYTIV